LHETPKYVYDKNIRLLHFIIETVYVSSAIRGEAAETVDTEHGF